MFWSEYGCCYIIRCILIYLAPFRPDSTILFNAFGGFVKLNVGFVRVNVAPDINLVFHLMLRVN